MNARQLLRLYPRVWRERYGDEFLALLDDRALGATDMLDVALGALDAHLTSTARSAAMETTGGPMSVMTKVCARPAGTIPKRTARISAALMIGTAILMSAAGTVAKRSGWAETGDFLLAIAFPASLLTSLPVMYLRQHSWRVQLVMVAGPLVILSLITWLAVRF